MELQCPKCVEYFIRTGIAPFALGMMVKISQGKYECNVCGHKLEFDLEYRKQELSNF